MSKNYSLCYPLSVQVSHILSDSRHQATYSLIATLYPMILPYSQLILLRTVAYVANYRPRFNLPLFIQPEPSQEHRNATGR